MKKLNYLNYRKGNEYIEADHHNAILVQTQPLAVMVLLLASCKRHIKYTYVSKEAHFMKAKAKKKTPAEIKEDVKETPASRAAEKKVADKVTGTYNGKKVYTGPKGGKYYINSNGNKTYIQD